MLINVCRSEKAGETQENRNVKEKGEEREQKGKEKK